MTTGQIVKCRCRNCDGHLEFEANRDGEALACPHCGMETQLYIPGRARLPIEHGKLAPAKGTKKQPLRALTIGAISIVFIGGLVYFLVTSEVVRGFVGGGICLVLAVVVAVFALGTAILWIIFPVFVYFGIERLERLLQQIESNTRKH